jgi:predicted NAD-dependent protein-ADP-ribosyltransferase YbiA (DUF1768 family)
MFNSVWNKFTQNSDLAEMLKRTSGRTIAFASRNTNWGTGTHLAVPATKNMAEWPGENKMGKILAVVREYLE